MSGKLVILAGGISSRMKRPAGNDLQVEYRLLQDADRKAKSMIGVGQNFRPFLDYLLYNAWLAGYTDILIVIGEKDSSIREYYGSKDDNNHFGNLLISYAVQKIPQGRVKPLGTADALYQALIARPDWEGQHFTVCNSDNLYSVNALSLMLSHKYQNAMIDYDRRALQFPAERIQEFGITKKDRDGFLMDIVEKPTAEQIQKASQPDGFVGVSMNIFSLSYDMIFSYLENVPLHPVRQEKELPQAVVNMVKDHPRSVYCFPVAEHVPDLTDKRDIPVVKQFIESNFRNLQF